MLRRFCTLFISLCALSSIAAESYSYPELDVTPRTSTRLKMEAVKESKRGFLKQPSIQLTAMATTLSGIMMLDNGINDKNSDSRRLSALAGITVGLTWVFLPELLGKKQFRKAYRNISKLPVKTKRQQLIKERLAEEEIRSIRSFSWRMRILSAVTSIGALGYMASNTKEETIGTPAIVASMVLAAAPLILSCPWKTPADQQEEYKKRIYGPIASATLLSDPKKPYKLVPGMLLSFRF